MTHLADTQFGAATTAAGARSAAAMEPGAAKQRAVEEVALAALLSSRICHDLVGPIGALDNGVAYIGGSVDQDTRDHAVRIIADSVRDASARLQFYRAAFGAGGALGDGVRLSELKTLTENLLRGGRVQLDWEPGEQEISRGAMRLILNLVLIGAETMPRGGVLHVGVVPDESAAGGGWMLLVVAEGRHLRFSHRIRALLLDGALPADEPPLEPKESPAALTYRLAQDVPSTLSFAEEEGQIIIAATL